MTDVPTSQAADALAMARLEALMQHAADHVIFVDRDGNILAINHIVKPLTMDQVIGTSMFDWIAPESVQEQRDGLKRVFEDGETCQFETKSIGEDHTEAWYTSKISPVRRDGQITEAIIVAFNITEKRQADLQLRKSQASLAEAQEMAHLGFWEWDLVEDKITWSDELCRIFGLAPGHHPQNIDEVWQRVHPDDLAMIQAETEASQKEKRLFESTSRFIREDGAIRHLRSVGRLDYNATGQPIRLLGSALDITEQYEANLELIESKERLDLTVRTTELGLWDWNVAEGDCFFSEHWTGMLGYANDEIKPHYTSWDSLIHPDDKPQIMVDLTEHLEGHVPTYQGDIRMKTKDGRWKWIHTKGRVVHRDEDGKPLRMIGIHQDIDRDKQAAQELVESKERMDLAVRSTELGLWDWNVTTNETFFNEQWCGMLGYQQDEIVPHVDSWGSLLHPDDQPKIYKQLMDHHEGRCPTYESEVRMRTKSGGWKWIHTNGRVVARDPDGKPLRMIGTHRDIDAAKRAEIALRESEAKWRSITEHSPDHIMTLDIQGHIQFINHAADGLTVESVVGKHVNEFVHEKFHQHINDCFGRVAQTGKSDRYEVDFNLPNGDVAHFEARVGPILDEKNKVTGFTVSSSDATERRRNEERLRFTQFAIDHSGDAAYWINPDGKFAYINESACQSLGYDQAQLIQMAIQDIDPDSTAESWAQHFEDVKKEGPIQLVTTHRRKNGEVFLVEITANHLQYGDREYICAFGRDITERRMVEDQIHEQAEVIRKVIGTVPHSVFWKDRASIYQGCNERFATESGVGTPEHIVGKTDFDLAWKTEEAEFFRQCDQQVMDQNLPMLNIEEPQLQSDGTEATLLTSKVPLRDEDGQVIGILGIYTDITERKRFEQVLVDYQQQLRSLAAQVAEAEQTERRRIATGLHDQIGQLLAIAKIKLDALRKDAEGKALERADEIADLMTQAIRDTRTLTFELCPPALYELGLEAALEELCEQFERRHAFDIQFHDDEQEKPLPEEIRVLLFQATRELLRNVVRHADTAEAEVSVQRQGDQLMVAVQDNGVGFPTTDGRETERAGGGFGLFNIRERLTRIGGFMSIESGEGKGCCIRLITPLILEPQRGTHTSHAPPAKETRP